MKEGDALHLFEGYGIELEYMIVGAGDLSVRPVADELLRQVGGSYELEVELGPIAWSNELALHVVELKTNGPAAELAPLAELFAENVSHVNRLLEPMEARLLPTAMHPWMDPHAELELWPHENDTIYRTFHRIFDCTGHGWANLQSAHINLPFADDVEFGRLHAAIRAVLPLIPALAASSPFVDGRASGMLDTRLDYYRRNARRIPSVAGLVIPEPVYTRREYEDFLLGGIYRDLEPHDPEAVLCHEWVNSRGCIARFDRMAIEIRLIDVQECPRADLAVAAAIVATVRSLVEEWHESHARLAARDARELAAVLAATIVDADRAVIDDRRLLDSFGFPEGRRARAAELWQHLFETRLPSGPATEPWREPLDAYLNHGCLARRMLDGAGPAPRRADLERVSADLADCLAAGRIYVAG